MIKKLKIMFGLVGNHEEARLVFTNHSLKHFLSFSPTFCKLESNTTSDWLNHNLYGLANQKLCYFQTLLNKGKSRE